MNRIIFIAALICAVFVGITHSSCSDKYSLIDEPDAVEEVVDTRGYYYEGEILLTKAEDGKKVYKITQPMMYPMLYGYVIPIPVPDYKSNISINMGNGTLIQQESVRYTLNGVEYVKDLPMEGTIEYEEGFSITRISEDEISVYIDPKEMSIYYAVNVIVTPKPYWAFDDSANAKPEDRFQKFESPEDFNLPANIGLQFLPYTFTDTYRPIRQYHMIVY